MSQPPAFRLFGFPVHVRVGFLVFLALVMFVNGPEFGIWLAAFMAGFTLLHELGHAFAARATGAEAEIALDFFYGYASFVPTRPLKRWERAGISFAGPGVQVLTGAAVLYAVGVNPLDVGGSIRDAELWHQALWWAGPVIGAFNLIPVLPLDGGNIAQAGLEAVTKRHARPLMLGISLALTIGGLITVALTPRLQGFVLFAAFPLIAQLQMLSQYRAAAQRDRSGPVARAAAESNAWRTGDLSGFVHGIVPSPWLQASIQLRHGRPGDAQQSLTDAFQPAAHDRWTYPDDAPPAELSALVELLGHPLPTGNPHAEYALGDVLCTLGEYDRAAHYAALAYTGNATAGTAMIVARSAAALGDTATMRAWLEVVIRDVAQRPVARRQLRCPEIARHPDDPLAAAVTAQLAAGAETPTPSG